MRLAVALLIGTICMGCTNGGKVKTGSALEKQIDRFTPVRLAYDLTQLTPGDRKVLDLLIEAARGRENSGAAWGDAGQTLRRQLSATDPRAFEHYSMLRQLERYSLFCADTPASDLAAALTELLVRARVRRRWRAIIDWRRSLPGLDTAVVDDEED